MLTLLAHLIFGMIVGPQFELKGKETRINDVSFGPMQHSSLPVSILAYQSASS